jgi:hypothetical protein
MAVIDHLGKTAYRRGGTQCTIPCYGFYARRTRTGKRDFRPFTDQKVWPAQRVASLVPYT